MFLFSSLVFRPFVLHHSVEQPDGAHRVHLLAGDVARGEGEDVGVLARDVARGEGEDVGGGASCPATRDGAVDSKSWQAGVCAAICR